MNEQQLQQMLTIQQAIAAAATAALINSVLNPQQQQQQQQQLASGGANSPTGQLDANNRTAQDLLLHLQQQAAVANLTQQQHDADQQDRPDSRLDSPVGTNSPANNQPIDTNNQTIQSLLLQLQAAAGSNPLSAISNASALAALNLNLNNQIPSPQLQNINNGASSVSRASMVQNDPFLSAPPTTSGNIQQQANQMPSNKKLKRYHQPQPNLQRPTQDATSKQHSSPKNHSTISNLAPRNNPSSTTNTSTSSSSPFLPNNVGLPRKLVRGQDVWLGRGAEQTRQILKCMWCGQSFRTLAEMTQHMKVTQHYTNIISQEQITSWKQPDSSDTNMGKQPNRQPLHQPKLLDDVLDTSSDKFNDSDRDDSFSNDDEPLQKVKTTKSKQSSGTNKSPNQISKVKRESGLVEQQQTAIKSASKNRRGESEERSNLAELSLQEDSDAENSSTSVASSHKRSLNTSGDALRGNDQSNKVEESTNRTERVKPEIDEEQTNPTDSDNRSNASMSPEIGSKRKTNGDYTEDPVRGVDREKSFEIDESQQINDKEADQDGESEQKGDVLDDEQKDTNDESDKIIRKRGKDKADIESLKQVAEAPKGDGSGDPLSALETMVEKSFDPRLRPGLASGGILQRLGIDEEVCPPWQHINYANWYAAAAYGHPMAAALLAAGMNLQNGIKLSKNMNQKKGDD